MWKIGICAEKIMSAAILVLQRKKRYITKGIQTIFKNIPSAEGCKK